MRRRVLHTVIVIIAVLPALAVACATRQPQSFEEVDTGSMEMPSNAEFEVAEYSTVAVEKSLAKGIVEGNFRDSDSDGIPDTVIWGDREIRGDIDREKVRGFAYSNGRYVAFYPADLTAFPPPGEVRLFGFFHYFDDYFLDIPMAVVMKQKEDDASKTGAVIIFLDNKGFRTANPAYGFLPRGEIEALDSFPRWTSSGLDFALATDPREDQFFIILKEFNLPEEIFFVAFKWY